MTVPMYHASSPGWARVFFALGGTVVLGPYHDLAEMCRLITDEGVTATLMVPPVLSRLLAHPASAELRQTSRLRFLLTGGQHLNRWIVNEAWDRFGPVLHHYYGSTETGLVTLLGPDELALSPCRSGRAMPGIGIAVLDAEHRPLPPGARGRVAVASYQLMDAYGDAPAPSVLVDLSDGQGPRPFLLTGDDGVIDYEGSWNSPAGPAARCGPGPTATTTPPSSGWRPSCSTSRPSATWPCCGSPCRTTAPCSRCPSSRSPGTWRRPPTGRSARSAPAGCRGSPRT
ncbi:AMP-binding protein [Kitasatospora arboriphila]